MMAREPQRSERARPLDAAIVPVQRALIARAKELEAETQSGEVQLVIAAEFRSLASELAHW